MISIKQAQLRLFWLAVAGVFASGCASNPGPVADSASAAGVAVTGSESTLAIIRYDARTHPVLSTSGMVVSQNQLASEIGAEILARGGNAADAAVAVGFALAVTLPRAGNLGGSGFTLAFDAESGKTLALDYRSAGPAAFDPDQHRDQEGEVDTSRFTFGPAANGVPGTVAGLTALWEASGSLPWAELVEPARLIAADGIIVTSDLAFALDAGKGAFKRYASSTAVYYKPDGASYAAGERWRQPDLAETLALIRDEGGQTFYTGELARRLVSGLAESGGLVTAGDLASYQARVRAPITRRYRDHTVVTMPPVSGGGLTLLQMLGVLEQFDLASMPQGSAESLHLIAEVMKRSAANRRFGLGDPDFVDVAVDGFLSQRLIDELAAKISLVEATPASEVVPLDASAYESRDTTHFSIVDQWGNAVSTTYTLGYSFGSYFVVPGTGILLDNQLRNFSYRADGKSNAFAPGKRMLSTMTPTLVFDEGGELLLVTGTPGGSRIINVILQVLLNVIDYDMNIAEATEAPRAHQAWRSPELHVEPGVSADTIALLRGKGHTVKVQQSMGSTQSILVRDGLVQGAADPRRPGAGAVPQPARAAQ